MDRGREVEEPTAIERGEPSLTEFTELLLLPVDYSSYERRLLATERTSSPEAANLMRALLARMRQISSSQESVVTNGYWPNESDPL